MLWRLKREASISYPSVLSPKCPALLSAPSFYFPPNNSACQMWNHTDLFLFWLFLSPLLPVELCWGTLLGVCLKRVDVRCSIHTSWQLTPGDRNRWDCYWFSLWLSACAREIKGGASGEGEWPDVCIAAHWSRSSHPGVHQWLWGCCSYSQARPAGQRQSSFIHYCLLGFRR